LFLHDLLRLIVADRVAEMATECEDPEKVAEAVDVGVERELELLLDETDVLVAGPELEPLPTTPKPVLVDATPVSVAVTGHQVTLS
jgi:hypothetical protein